MKTRDTLVTIYLLGSLGASTGICGYIECVVRIIIICEIVCSGAGLSSLSASLSSTLPLMA